MARIRPAGPRVERAPFVDGVLTFAAPGDRIEDIRALIETGAHRGAVTLVIGHTSIGDAVLALIATTRAYPAVTELRVGGAGVTDAGVHALATHGVGLEALRDVHLGDAPDGRASGGISDAAVAALASSPRLPALARITRSIEHHVYAPDARDVTEVTEVRRADGRVVQCVVERDLWP